MNQWKDEIDMPPNNRMEPARQLCCAIVVTARGSFGNVRLRYAQTISENSEEARGEKAVRER